MPSMNITTSMEPLYKWFQLKHLNTSDHVTVVLTGDTPNAFPTKPAKKTITIKTTTLAK